MSELLFEVLSRFVCYPVGWLVVKCVTLGRYPSRGGWAGYTPASEWTCAVGLAVLVVGALAAIGLFADYG